MKVHKISTKSCIYKAGIGEECLGSKKPGMPKMTKLRQQP